MHDMTNDQPRLTRDQRMALLQRRCAKFSLRIEQLPSGIWWVHGPGVDIRATDLSYVNPHDVVPVQRAA
jgi:hypothetical protein